MVLLRRLHKILIGEDVEHQDQGVLIGGDVEHQDQGVYFNSRRVVYGILFLLISLYPTMS